MDVRAPQLQAPGAGVPAWQRLAGKYVLLPFWCLRCSWERVPDVLEAQASGLLRVASSLSDEQLQRRVLVPPQIGLEDSSRYHSYSMVLEHLTIVGHAVTRIVVDLSCARRPAGVVRTADLKPRGLAPAVALAGYRNMLAAFRHAALDECEDRRSRTRFEHPWFGPLNAFQWLCFAPFHQVIHVAQARAIRRLLGEG